MRSGSGATPTTYLGMAGRAASADQVSCPPLVRLLPRVFGFKCSGRPSPPTSFRSHFGSRSFPLRAEPALAFTDTVVTAAVPGACADVFLCARWLAPPTACLPRPAGEQNLSVPQRPMAQNVRDDGRQQQDGGWTYEPWIQVGRGGGKPRSRRYPRGGDYTVCSCGHWTWNDLLAKRKWLCVGCQDICDPIREPLRAPPAAYSLVACTTHRFCTATTAPTLRPPSPATPSTRRLAG